MQSDPAADDPPFLSLIHIYRLGGDDFDQRIINWLIEGFKAESGIDLTGDKMAMQRLKEAAEKAKIELSGMTTASINLPFITADATGPDVYKRQGRDGCLAFAGRSGASKGKGGKEP